MRPLQNVTEHEQKYIFKVKKQTRIIFYTMKIAGELII